MAYPTGSTPEVTTHDEYILGPDNTPFFTTRWAPANEEPKAYIIFVHGFSEHITRYHDFFRRLAASPSSLHITAFDQRGHGRTSHVPIDATHEKVVEWREQGKTVNLEKDGKRRTGGWAKVMPDIEWFVKRESDLATSKGKKLFLHGFSMGGGEVLAFATRPHAPPSKATLNLLSGVIAGGPMIRQTTPAPYLKFKAGTMAASLGLGNMLIPAPMNIAHLSHNDASNQRAAADPFCEQVGSVKGLADMLQGGMTLDTQATWDRWPKDLPLFVYHGEKDPICDSKASERFAAGIKAENKKAFIIKDMLHEVHNELEPTPTNVANEITAWVHGVISSGESSAAAVPASNGATAGVSKL